MDKKKGILILAVAFALVIGVSGYITGNASKFYIDKGLYFSPSGESQCNKVGGTGFEMGGPGKFIKNKEVKLLGLAEDIVLVSVDGARRGIEPGHEKYVAGLFVTVFSTGYNDACLIVRDFEKD